MVELRENWKIHTLSFSRSAAPDKSASRPEDIVHLYSSLAQILQDMLALPGVEEDDDLADSLQAKLTSVRAHRCYFLAETYSSNSKVGRWVGVGLPVGASLAGWVRDGSGGSGGGSLAAVLGQLARSGRSSLVGSARVGGAGASSGAKSAAQPP